MGGSKVEAMRIDTKDVEKIIVQIEEDCKEACGGFIEPGAHAIIKTLGLIAMLLADIHDMAALKAAGINAENKTNTEAMLSPDRRVILEHARAIRRKIGPVTWKISDILRQMDEEEGGNNNVRI